MVSGFSVFTGVISIVLVLYPDFLGCVEFLLEFQS